MTSPDRAGEKKDKLLFTPGPLTTSSTVKEAMLRDLGSRDTAFIAAIETIRNSLLGLAGLSREKGYECALMQGSGTFGVESVIGSAVPPGGKLLVVINGAYGERMLKIADVLGIECEALRCGENTKTDPDAVARRLDADGSITTVAIVHCETTTGIINPVEETGALVRERGKTYIVDAMSSFGAVALDLEKARVDFLVSSANKCIEGVPGFSFAICRGEALARCEGQARSLSLDLFAQWKGLESNGQFRFTPPTHTILAFEKALEELAEEGGVAGRAARYSGNYDTLVAGMSALGFKEYLPREDQGYIITSFRYPTHPAFDFTEFYTRLSEKSLVIYPGKVSDADCFRIGNIGRIEQDDVKNLLTAIASVLEEMGIASGA
ncbi:MAG: 2-aminoethylphosphonate--pyruvate transaminase [Planctomycetota bacterium]|jgi:2-aminoethylphosphonate-pyruvate transaminase|nr:2-aminoethylphosphonate--pyruvate transaminase [Planctomycetota bacterium]